MSNAAQPRQARGEVVPLVIELDRLAIAKGRKTTGPGQLDPRRLPPITAHIQTLAMAGTPDSELRFVTSQHADGLSLDELELRLPHVR